MDAVKPLPGTSCSHLYRAEYSDKAQHGVPAPKGFTHWKVSSPAQGVHSAVRMKTAERTEMDVEPSVRVVTQTTNQTAIQLLKTLKIPEKARCLKYIAEALRELETPGISLQSSEALNEVMEYLVCFKLEYSDNIPVLEKLLELGCIVPVEAISSTNKLMSISLIEKLCSCSENPKAFVRKNSLLLLSLGEKRSYQLLMAHLTEQEVIQVVLMADPYDVSELFEAKGYMTTLPDICPEVVALMWKALLPITVHELDQLEQDLDKGITTPFQKACRFTYKGVLIETLIWLNYHNYPETLSVLMAKLPENYRQLLRLLSLSLGLDNFSSCLARTGLPPFSDTDTDTHLLHQLIHLTRGMGDLALDVEIYTSLTPLFISFGMSREILTRLASQRDERGRLPLQVLLEDRLSCTTSDPMFLMDHTRFQSWFDFLLQHTPRADLPQSLELLFNSEEAKNVNYYGALLKFIRAGCDLTKVCKPVNEGGPLPKWLHNDLPVSDFIDNSSKIQALLGYFQQFPDTLSFPDKTEQMMQELELSPAFQAVTVLAMEPGKRRELLAIWRESPQRMASLFIDRDFSMKQCYTGPWLPFMAIMQHDLPEPEDTAAAIELEKHVEEYLGRTSEQTIPNFPPDLMELWQSAEKLDMYGRSVRLGQKQKCPSGTEGDSIRDFRLKFRKKDLDPEPWEDFIREQAVLSFVGTPETPVPPVPLESQLLKAGGVYQLPKARSILSRNCYLPEEFRKPLEESVHINPDGSASVQVLEDSPGTEHYHHYPYLIDSASGLTRESAFEGIRLYCRDSGKLWRMSIKSPDALGVYHNQAGSKPWNPLPGYALRRKALFCTSSLCSWNRQIPDIAHAPAGMRDYQGIIAMRKLPDGIYGERRLNWSDPLDMRRARLIELGKQFYGVTLNWLRVRHDLNELDHRNSEHLQALCREMVTLYADLFSSAFNGDVNTWKDSLLNVLPAGTLQQAARECLYWCSPQHPYVADIRSGRFPSEVYPEHNHSNLKLYQNNLFEDGFKSHPSAPGSNLGHTFSDNMVLHHLAAVFWFGVMEGVLTQQP